MLQQRRLDLGAVDVLAAADDHVLLAVDDVVEAGLVAIAEVAGAEPAAAERRLGGLGIVPVAGDDVRPADPDLADLALGDVVAVVVDDAHVGGRRRAGRRCRGGRGSRRRRWRSPRWWSRSGRSRCRARPWPGTARRCVRIRSGGTGAPPEATPISEVMSRARAARGLQQLAHHDRHAGDAGQPVRLDQPHRPRAASTCTSARASCRSRRRRRGPVRPPIWKNGKVCSAPGCGAFGSARRGQAGHRRAPRRRPAGVFIRLVTWLRWVAIAPFGLPVVPEV